MEREETVKKSTPASEPARRPNLQALYEDTVKDALIKDFNYKNVMEIPRLSKIVINMGSGEGARDSKVLESLLNDLALLSGQKPVITRAKKSIANFKVRVGMPLGCMVTLRKRRMYEFMDKLVNISIPRIRDFRGISPRSFDGRGNFTMGISEQLIFPEVDYDKIAKVQGMNISIVTTAETDEEALALLSHLGMPFKQR